MTAFLGDIDETIFILIAALQGLPPLERRKSLQTLRDYEPKQPGVRLLLKRAIEENLPPSEYPLWLWQTADHLADSQELTESAWDAVIDDLDNRFPRLLVLAESAARAESAEASGTLASILRFMRWRPSAREDSITLSDASAIVSSCREKLANARQLLSQGWGQLFGLLGVLGLLVSLLLAVKTLDHTPGGREQKPPIITAAQPDGSLNVPTPTSTTQNSGAVRCADNASPSIDVTNSDCPQDIAHISGVYTVAVPLQSVPLYPSPSQDVSPTRDLNRGEYIATTGSTSSGDTLWYSARVVSSSRLAERDKSASAVYVKRSDVALVTPSLRDFWKNQSPVYPRDVPVNVRYAPSLRSGVADVLTIGDSAAIVSDSVVFADGYFWLHIQLSNGLLGYACSSYLLPAPHPG